MESLGWLTEDAEAAGGRIGILRKTAGLRHAEVGQTLLGVPRGRSPLASLGDAEQAPVHCGLPRCETCLTARRRFRSLGVRRQVVSGLAICPERRCPGWGRRVSMNLAYAVKMLTSTDQQTKMQKKCTEDILMHLSV